MSCKQLLPLVVQSRIASSATLRVTTITSSNWIPTSNMVNKNTNFENFSSTSQKSEGNRVGQEVSSKNTVSSRKQQHIQAAEKYEYKQQLQNQLPTPICNARNIAPSKMQSEIPSREQPLIFSSQKQPSIRQPPSVLQSAHSTSAFHQKPNQTPIFNQKGKQKPQQPVLPLQKQFPNATNSCDGLNGQKTVPDMQCQQELLGHTNSSSSNEYLLGHQNNASSLSGQSSNSNMYNNEKKIYMGPQAEVMVQQQPHRMEANTLPHNQQSVCQMQVQQAKLQSQPNPLQRGKSVQTSGSLLPSQHLFEQQKQASESKSCTSQISHTNGDDWKEELYQKIQTKKDLYLPNLNEIYRKISHLLRRVDSVPQHTGRADYEKYKALAITCKRFHELLHLPKSQMSQTVERNLHDLEDNVNMLLRRVEHKRSISSLQQEQLPPHDVQSVQQLQSQLQNPEVKSNGNQTNPHLQSTSSDGSATEKEKKANNIIRASTVFSQGPNLQKNMMNSQQPGNNLNAERGNVVCLFPGNTSQSYTSSSRGVGNVPQRTINNLEMCSNMSLLQQNEQKMIKSQLPKRKSQQRQMTKQSVQQTEAHQIPQLHLNEVNKMKVRQGISFKEGSLLQHHSTGKLSVRNPHVLRSGPPSPQLIQASSPQVPQFDQKILHMSLPNSGSRLHSPNSRSVWPSPSTSIGPFHIKGDPSKLTSAVSSVTNPGDVKLKETSSKLPLHSSYVISTPGLSPSYLLGESDGPDGNQNQVSTPDFCESRVTEEPILRLVKAVRSLSYKSLSASISDMESVVRLVDSAAESKPGNGSRSAIDEDFGGVANLILQGEKIDRNARKTKMRRCIGAVQSNICASSCETDSFKKLTDPKKFAESTATSHNKKLRSEVKCILSHEIREINQRLIDTVVDISEEVDSTCGIPETEGSHGTIVRCSFNAVTINPDMTSIHVSAVMPLLSPLLLLVPRNYPDCSPVLLDKLPAEVSSGYEDLSGKAKSKLSVIMRNLLQPMSVGDIAKSWDFCAREVIREYAQLNGGGNFSSTYGTWENHLSTA